MEDTLLEGSWRCAVCTFENLEPLQECEICSTARGRSPLLSECSGFARESSETVAETVAEGSVLTYTWCWYGGTSRLILRTIGSSGQQSEESAIHSIEGQEPPTLWTGSKKSLALHAAARCAKALAEHLPPQEFLPIFCRPENVVARRSFSRQYLLELTLDALTKRDAVVRGCQGYSDQSVGIADISLDAIRMAGDACDQTPETPKPQRRSEALMTPVHASREDAILARQGRLRERVMRYGLYLDGVASDGNCLFRADRKSVV